MVTDDTLTPTSGVGGVHPSSKCILTMHCEIDCQCALRGCRHCYFNNIPPSLDLDIFMCGLHGNKKNRNQNWESRIFLLQFRKGLKYFILIDADNFIKKHFITKEKTDSAHPPPHPGPHCLKSSQDVPWLGWGGRWVQQTRYFETDVWAAHSTVWNVAVLTRAAVQAGTWAGCTDCTQHWRHWTLDTGNWGSNSCQMPNVWVLHSTIVLSAVTGVTYISLGHLFHKPNNPNNTMYYVSLLLWGRFR